MKIGVPRELSPGEKRVAIVPETVKRLAAKKIEVVLEAGAGAGAYTADADYVAAGATIAPSAEALYASVDAVAKIGKPTEAEVAKYREGTLLVSLL